MFHSQTSINGSKLPGGVCPLSLYYIPNALTLSVFYFQMSADALIMQKRAEITAKIAAMSKSSPASVTPTPTPKPSLPSSVTHSPAPAKSHSHSPSPGPLATDDISRRVAEAKRRVADAQSKLAVKDNPYMVRVYQSLVPVLRRHSFLP
jgi:hypothetical protein